MSVKKLIINKDNEGRRLDNFLLSIYKGVPKTKIYKKIDPIVDAPAPSYFRNFVNDNTKPPVVEKIINQKNLLFKLNLDNPG